MFYFFCLFITFFVGAAARTNTLSLQLAPAATEQISEHALKQSGALSFQS